jgi:hypothetical protein
MAQILYLCYAYTQDVICAYKQITSYTIYIHIYIYIYPKCTEDKFHFSCDIQIIKSVDLRNHMSFDYNRFIIEMIYSANM